MTMAKKILGAASLEEESKLYVDDVFSTYLYTGNGSTQTINNGIDLAGEGGRGGGGQWRASERTERRPNPRGCAAERSDRFLGDY